MHPSEKFAELVRLGMYGAGRTRLKCGNVTFWFVRDQLIFDPATSSWDTTRMNADLTNYARQGLERATDIFKTFKD